MLVTDPTLSSPFASSFVAELVDFAATCRLDYDAQPPRPPAPLAPPAPPSPPAPPAPPIPPAPPPPGPVSPQLTGNQTVLTLLLPSAFDEYLSEPESNKAQDEYVEVEHASGGRWGQLDDCPWDESAVGADGVTGDDDDDGVEYWSRDGLPEKLPIPTYPPNNRKRPHPSSQNRDARPPSPRHKLTDHKRQGYSAAEKLKWVALMDVAVSVRALARESGIHRKCLTNWKRAVEFLKDVHSTWKRMHGRGRASWYRPMDFWQFVRAKRHERGIDTAWIINADQTPLWLEMPATTTVEETGVRSVPIRSAGYQKQRVTVMLACTADGRKLKPWVFFKRKTLPKGDFPADVVVACHENGWMDSPGIVRWLEEGVKPFVKPRFGRHAKSSMLVLDSYRGHLTEEVKEKLREMNCVPAIIPSGCMAEVQLLDVCINKSFKASVLV
ncbi:unnamed protein product [Closterium sp. NIES-54]